MDHIKAGCYNNFNRRFGLVQIHNFIVTIDPSTYTPKHIIAEGPAPSQYQELYIHRFVQRAEDSVLDWLLDIINPNDKTPSIHRFTWIGGYIIFRDQLFVNVGECEIPVNHIQFLTEEERTRLATLT